MPEIEGALDPNTLTVFEVIGALVVLVIAGFVSRFTRRRIRTYLEQADGLAEGVPDVIGRVAGWSVLLIGVILALTVVGFDTSGLVLLIAVIALVAVFTGKELVENFAAGVLLQVRGPFRVGDRVATNDFTGTVEEINARTVVIETDDRRTVHIPNSDVLDKPIVNYTAHPVRRSEVRVGIDYAADVEDALGRLTDAAGSVPGVHTDPPPRAFLDEFGDSSVDLVVLVWHDDGDRRTVRSGVSLAVKRTLDESGIEIPFPQRVIHTDVTEG